MLAFLFLSVLGSWVSLGGDYSAPPDVTVLEADESHAVIQLDLSGYTLDRISEYSRIDVAEYDWDMEAPVGNPELPLIPVVLAVPAGMDASVTLLDADWQEAGYGTPYPVQPIQMDSDPHPLHFAELSTNLEGIYPTQTLKLAHGGIWAGVNTTVLQMNPFTWDAGTGEFQVASSMIVRVDFSGPGAYQTSVRPEIANMHRSRLVNYDALDIVVDSSPISEDDIVYICAVPEENLEAITPLLTMVNSLGHHVNIITIESGLNSYQIVSAIKAVYQEGMTRFALIPARYQQIESKNYGAFVGDFYYELMTPDNLPDIAVGRYSGNAAQLENQIAKTMSYITYEGVPGEPSLPASVILAAHEEDYPGKYTANSEAVRTFSYDLADIVFETAYAGEGGTGYPEQVAAAIDEGVGIVNYRGHGSTTTWQWQGNWNAGAIYDLENTFFPPVFNVCCNNGEHDLVYNCLSESWMDAPGIGASGNLGASAPSATVANNRMQRVLFWQIFEHGNTCAGEMFTASQTDIIQTQPGSGLNNSKMYHWFGDPSMDIPNSDLSGAPFGMEIDVPSSVNSGTNSLNLTVMSDGSPVEGAVVTVTDGVGNHPDLTESFYAQQVTDASGEVQLDFTSLGDNDLFYGVRLHNYASLTGTIEVVSTGIEGGQSFTAELLPITPSPVSGMASIEFTAPGTGNVNISVLDLAGRVVSVVQNGNMPAGSSSRTIDSSEFSPGVYFVMMQTAETTITRKIAIVH